MTTQKSKVSNEIITAAAPTPAAPLQVQPRSIVLIGTGISVLQELTVLARQGWKPDENMPPQVFGAAGTMQVFMIPGTPDERFTNAAAITLSEAAQREQAQYDRDVERAATRQLEAKARAVAEAKRAAMIEEQMAALAALEKQLAIEAATEAAAK
jgi:hypothetical protein